MRRLDTDSLKAWIKYAQWEASQNEFERYVATSRGYTDIVRSRSVFERALDIEPRSVEIWIKYTDMVCFFVTLLLHLLNPIIGAQSS